MGGLTKASALTAGEEGAWEGFPVNKVVLQEDLLLGGPELLQSGFYFGGIHSGVTKETEMGDSLARTSCF